MLHALSVVFVAAIAAVAAAGPCSLSPFPLVATAGQMFKFTLAPPEFGDCPRSITVVSPPTYGQLSAIGDQLIYRAPLTEADDVASLTIACTTSQQTCDMLVGFLVSNPIQTTVAPTTAAPTTAPTTTPAATSGQAVPTTTGAALTSAAPPTTTTVTTTTTTTAAPLPQCSASVTASVALNGVFTTTLQNPSCTGIATFGALPSNPKGRLYVNLVGSLLVMGASVEAVDAFGVVASCDTVPVCTMAVRVVTFAIVSAPPTTAAPPTIGACPSIYYYDVTVAGTFSSSLRAMPGQPFCAAGLSFVQTKAPAAGALALSLGGDFTFNPPSGEGWFDFGFTLSCLGAPVCNGIARLLVTNRVTLQPVTTFAPATTAAPQFVSDGFTTCSGTCSEDAWKVLPSAPLGWDTDIAAIATKVSSLSVDFINGSLVVTGYARIGSLAARFLTFDPVTDFSGLSAAPLASFSDACLKKQPPIGFGEDVWKWTSYANQTGRVGLRYSSGSSYYHKFGGKHIGCDTYAKDACRFAPLATPADGWKIDVAGCDQTWTGTFNLTRLLSMRMANGNKVFYYTRPNELQGTIYSEAVKPKSWLEPGLGTVTTIIPHVLSMRLDTEVIVSKSDPAALPFTLDAQYFEYTDASGDAAFGINILFFSIASEGAEPFAADRHVRGFKWLKQKWNSPSASSCPQCIGRQQSCTTSNTNSEVGYTGAFPSGTCPGTTGIVQLTKGPLTDLASCPRPAEFYIMNQLGFSPPTGCGKTFQNLTIRGKAKGSSMAMFFDGKITLQLLLENGNKPTVDLVIAQYVSRVASDRGLSGTMDVCRSSPYWPVFDPLGASLPTSGLSARKETEGVVAPSRYLCLDNMDLRFGPTGWSVFSLNIPGLDPAAVIIDSVSLLVPGDVPIYLLYRDAPSQRMTEPPATAGYWWKRTHPFLNFRVVPNASVSYAPALNTSNSAIFAFTMTPGTLSIDSELLVTVVARAVTTNPDGTKSMSGATFRRFIHIDPQLTALTRYGVATVGEGATERASNSMMLELAILCGATIGIVVVGILFVSGDDERPLPKWIPRAKLFRRAVLSITDAHHFYKRPAPKKKAEPADPYAFAMESKPQA